MSGKNTVTNEKIIEKFNTLFKKYGRIPTHIEWDNAGGIGTSTVRRRFRTFENLAAIVQSGDISKEAIDDLQNSPKLFDSLTKQNSLLVKENVKLKNFQQMVVMAVEAALAKVKPIKIEIPEIKETKDHFEHANLLLSDEQIGTKFSLAETMGKNAYDFNSFLNNNKILRKAVVDIAALQAKAYPIPRLNIWAAGDDVEGELIFKGQQFNIDRPLIDQVIDGAYALTETLIHWAQVFPEIHIYQVWGNHGRSGSSKGEGNVRSNWDSVFWKIIELTCKAKGITNVIFHLSMSTTLVASVFGHNILLSHGNETRGWMGIPFYGRSRDVLKMVNALELPIKLALCGHFHNVAAWDVAPNCQIIMNGSWIGGSPYSTVQLKTINTPKQIMWGTCKKHVKTWSYDIELHAIKKLTASADGLFTPVYESRDSQNAK